MPAHHCKKAAAVAIASLVTMSASRASFTAVRASSVSPYPQKTASVIRLNSIGFLPDHQKRASIAGQCTGFRVIDDSDGSTAFQGLATGPIHNTDTNEDLWVVDFSALNRSGAYHLDVPGAGRSATFRIGHDVYDVPFRTAVQAMYLWRCGTDVRAVYNGTSYSHGACHLEDAWLDETGGGHVQAKSTGGWHDAGDYNKYVVNAGVTVGTMLLAWKQFPQQITRLKLNIAADDDGKVPAYLAEIKWEMDWLLTMQAQDGSVYHKVTTKTFGPAIMPEKEQTPRFFAPWSSAATADFIAMAAMSAGVYKPYDPAFADRCLEAARRSYAFLRDHPENHLADLKAFSTGAYQTDDADDRLWAAAELWEATGDPACLADFETRAPTFKTKFDADWGWSNVKNLGMLAYLFSARPGRNAPLVEQLRDSLLATADWIVGTARAHGYGRPIGATYYWGCNGGVANTTVLLQSAARMNPKAEYIETALDAVGFLFGRNYYGRSFVTGLGARPPEHPHDRRSMGQPGAPAWPGYLVGGGWPKATDWKDESPHYELNEVAINWNAALIYALAGFVR
ncbi:MAG TPA: glycoside hydrolase family 9 protein [Blastocatellia bacterium]